MSGATGAAPVNIAEMVRPAIGETTAQVCGGSYGDTMINARASAVLTLPASIPHR